MRADRRMIVPSKMAPDLADLRACGSSGPRPSGRRGRVIRWLPVFLLRGHVDGAVRAGVKACRPGWHAPGRSARSPGGWHSGPRIAERVRSRLPRGLPRPCRGWPPSGLMSH